MSPRAIDDLFALTTLQQPDDSIGFLLWRVAHRFQRQVDRALADLHVTHLQFVVLVQTAWLSRDGNVVTQVAMTRFGRIHPMQLSSVLKTLQTKGFVTRPSCPSQPRTKLVTLMPSAVELLAQALPRIETLQATFFGDDPASGADLRARLRQVASGWGETP